MMTRMKRHAFLWALVLGLTPPSLRSAGPPANLVPFGTLSVEALQAAGEKVYLSDIRPDHPLALSPGQGLRVEWNHPREVREVVVKFRGDAPAPAELKFEWWRRIWPDNGSGGWMKLDDPFNGQWTAAKTTADTSVPGQIRLSLQPLRPAEAPGIKRTGADYRHTYKVRFSASRPVVMEDFAIHSQAELRQARLRFEWGVKTRVAGHWSPRFEARNGHILKTQRIGSRRAEVAVKYAHADDRLSADRGVVIFRSSALRSFSVFVDDVLREGGLYVRDIGVFVSDAERHLTYATWPGPPGEVWKEGTVSEQVARLPEQNFEPVMLAIPPKPPTYLFLGVPNLRQEIALGPNGDLRLLADSLRSPGLDAERRPWSWKELGYHFSSGELPTKPGDEDPRSVSRQLEDGWLPVATYEWNEGGVRYQQSSVASTLDGDIADLKTTNGVEPVVLATQFKITNSRSNLAAARLWLELNHHAPLRPEPDGTLTLAGASDNTKPTDLTPVRGRFITRGKGRLEFVPLYPSQPGILGPDAKPYPLREALRYQVELKPGESHAVELHVPYIELLDARELAALKSLSFDAVHQSVVKFWKARVAQGMTYEVPEKFLNEFFKANLWHVLISTDLDPVTGQCQHGAATHHYKNYLNETAMVARSLEMRGEHEEARRLIETFLANQSVKGLPGNFKSKDGVLYAAHPAEPDPYTAQGYNMHHGWGMWAAAEHYEWTKDAAWLLRNAERLVKACEWVTRERQATKFRNPNGTRPIEFGLAPAGDLEDVEEYLYFYATSAYYHLGMKRVAEVLAKVGQASRLSQTPSSPGPPQDLPSLTEALKKYETGGTTVLRAAKRLARDAADFLRDIQASVAESVATTPVVRLKDGTHIPFVPPRAYALTHLSEGWIREGLYPALHLRDGEVYPEDHPYVDWMIQDLEDNIFLSKESGYGVENPRANFFNFGGFTLQPNLLDLPIAYLQRDQVPNFLRGFYNTGWASLYPDAMCFAEWVPAFGKGGGPLFKTPDECKFIQWMRQMLVLERGDRLELGLGVPRAWMADGQRVKVERAATFFGKVDLEIVSHAATGAVKATVKLTRSESPKAIGIRLRHPSGKPIISATVNGKRAKVNATRQLVELPVKADGWEVEALFDWKE